MINFKQGQKVFDPTLGYGEIDFANDEYCMVIYHAPHVYYQTYTQDGFICELIGHEEIYTANGDLSSIERGEVGEKTDIKSLFNNYLECILYLHSRFTEWE